MYFKVKSIKEQHLLSYTITFLLIFYFISVDCYSQRITINIDDPVFWTCDKAPTLPQGSPPSASAYLQSQTQECGGDNFSGMRLSANYQINGGVIPNGKSLMSLIDFSGSMGKTTGNSVECGDQKRMFAFLVPVYFKTPSIEFHMELMCCESKYRVVSESWVAIVDSNPQAKPIENGEYAGIAGNNSKQLMEAHDRIEKDRVDEWKYEYRYDGCTPNNPNPDHCKKKHCLKDLTIEKLMLLNAGWEEVELSKKSFDYDG